MSDTSKNNRIVEKRKQALLSLLQPTQAAVNGMDEDTPLSWDSPTPWDMLNPLDRAEMAVAEITTRMRNVAGKIRQKTKLEGEAAGFAIPIPEATRKAILLAPDEVEALQQDYLCLRRIIDQAIQAIESSPISGDWMQAARDWPSIVPGGSNGGPLRKAWNSLFEGRMVGARNPSIPLPKRRDADFEPGKPAWFAKVHFEFFEPIRELNAVKKQGDESKHERLARNLQKLAPSTVPDWVEASLAHMEHLKPSWTWWLRCFLPGHEAAFEGKMRRRKRLQSEATTESPASIRKAKQNTARSMVADNLRHGYEAFLKASE